MIDTIYKVLLTILNKENQGYVSPEEYNLLANLVQLEIFTGYLDEQNLDKNKQNRGLTNKGYANLAFKGRQEITTFAATSDEAVTAGVLTLPTDLYILEDQGITTDAGILIDEVERGQIASMMRTEVAPTALYPVYESYGKTLKIYPNTITTANVRYIRYPKEPKWTYTVVSNKELFNPSNGSYQDFELGKDEFYNIVIKMALFFGLNLREADVVQVAQAIQNSNNQKNN